MKSNLLFMYLFLVFSTYSFSQQFHIGERIKANSRDFKLLDYSPSMKVYTYQFVGKIESKYLFDRKVAEIIIGVKNGVVVTTIYNLKLIDSEHRIADSTLKMINKALGKELLFISHNSFAVTKVNKFISLKICNTPLTFGQPRIVYLTSVKYSILLP